MEVLCRFASVGCRRSVEQPSSGQRNTPLGPSAWKRWWIDTERVSASRQRREGRGEWWPVRRRESQETRLKRAKPGSQGGSTLETTILSMLDQHTVRSATPWCEHDWLARRRRAIITTTKNIAVSTDTRQRSGERGLNQSGCRCLAFRHDCLSCLGSR